MTGGPRVVVVGAGIVGLAVADALQERGAAVTCVDGGAPGAGQSAGAARGFRHLHADPALVALAVESRAAWRRLEARTGETLLGEEGSLRLGGDLEADRGALEAAGLRPRMLTRAEAQARLPALAPSAEPLLFDPDAGAVRAGRAVRVLAGRLRPVLRRAEVLEVEPLGGGGARVRTAEGEERADRCVVCAGAGTEAFAAPLGIVLDRDHRAHVRLTFALPGGVEGPVWSDRSGSFGPPAYGVSEGPGRFAVGIADPAAYAPVEEPRGDAAIDGIDLAPYRAKVREYVRAALPGLGEPVEEVARVTTDTRGGDPDAIALWERGDVLVLAGHNLFKHAPRLGELVADAVLGGVPDARLAPEPAGGRA